MPTNQQLIEGFEGIIASLQSVMVKYPQGKLDMYQPTIQLRDSDNKITHECGTVHCFASWWGVANQDLLDLDDVYVGYSAATSLMAQRLGFLGEYQLLDWAHDNPKIWGNQYGGNMFCLQEAFGKAGSLSGIVRHLKGVVNRLKECEKHIKPLT